MREKISELQDNNMITLLKTKERRNKTKQKAKWQTHIHKDILTIGQQILSTNNNARKQKKHEFEDDDKTKKKRKDLWKPLSVFKVIVNQKNNVPFHFVDFYNDHVPLVILLEKIKTKTILIL